MTDASGFSESSEYSENSEEGERHKPKRSRGDCGVCRSPLGISGRGAGDYSHSMVDGGLEEMS